MIRTNTRATDEATALSNRMPFYALLAANATSGTGNGLSNIAIPWFVLQTTGSAAQAGITGAFAFLPIVIAGIFGGTLIDRLGYRRTSILADVSSGVTIALIPLLYLTGALAFWQLLVLVFLTRLLDAPGVTARRSLVPELAGQAGMPLTRANGYFQAVQRLSTLLGPLLGGVMIAALGAANVLWFDAATFGISALLIVGAVSDLVPANRGTDGTASYFRELADGFRYIRGDVVIFALVLTILATNLIEAPNSVMLAVYGDTVYNSAISLGLMAGAFSAGAVVGSLGFGWVSGRIPRRLILPGAFLCSVAGFAVLALQPPLPVVMGALLLWGLAAGPVNPFMDTVFQERVPANMRGRVFGLRSAIVMMAIPLGVVAGGFVIVTFGLTVLLVGQGSLMVVVVLWMLVSPQLRQLSDDG